MLPSPGPDVTSSAKRPSSIAPPLPIAIALFDEAEELDWCGPWEVLRTWSHYWPDDGAQVFTVSRTDDVVTCAKGLRVLPDYSWESAPSPQVLIYPGGRGARSQMGDEAVLDWLRGHAERGTLMTSVCTGALVYAAAGLLDRRAATTHWDSIDDLRELGADIDVRPEERFVDAGTVITAAGVSAGIDMALHLVARLHSPARARDVRRYIQYDPVPPV